VLYEADESVTAYMVATPAVHPSYATRCHARWPQLGGRDYPSLQTMVLQTIA